MQKCLVVNVVGQLRFSVWLTVPFFKRDIFEFVKVLGVNSQNFLRKFFIFFVTLSCILESKYPLKISSLCFIQ